VANAFDHQYVYIGPNQGNTRPKTSAPATALTSNVQFADHRTYLREMKDWRTICQRLHEDH